MIITGNKQFDFQILRFTGKLRPHYPQIDEDLQHMAGAIHSFDTWYTWWQARAVAYEQDGLLELAEVYYRAALFYLSHDDERKQPTYQAYVRCFYSRQKDITRHTLETPIGHFPYHYLRGRDDSPTVLVVGGYDGFLEELTSWFSSLQQQLDYHFIILEGPGQGSVSFTGTYFIPDFSPVIGYFLDAFQLTQAMLIGVSWGGNLALRIAAHERRISHVVAFDIFYSPLDALQVSLGWLPYLGLKSLLALKQERLINRIINRLSRNDINLQWMLHNGYDITGEQTPYRFLQNIARHDIGSVLPQVKQPCLLLAGAEDLYVPKRRLADTQRGLKNAAQVTAHLFTRETGGYLHCQVDDIKQAMIPIHQFLHDAVHHTLTT